MLEFEENISEPSRASNYRVVFENDDENKGTLSELSSTMLSVTASGWKENIDFNVCAAFSVLLSSDQCRILDPMSPFVKL